jgi:hypothetical protein
MTGCGPLFTLQASQDEFDAEGGKNVPPLKDDEMAKLFADKFGLMALFAQVSYRDDKKSNEERTSICNDKPPSPIDDFGMPKNNEGAWMRSDLTNACINDKKSGLFYETYVFKKTQSENIEKAVISFRGTENTLEDWITNASAFFGIQPKQYALAREKLPTLIENLTKNNKDIRIYSVGHSLGGGLAQQAGYLFTEIDKVFTFNTSPVTNWTYLRLSNKDVAKEYPAVYRIYHGGEILEKLRFITTSFTSTSFRRYELGIQFEKRAGFKGHSMSILTCGFAALIASDSDKSHEAEHFYRSSDARKVVLNNSILCKSGPKYFEDLVNRTIIDTK